MTRVFRGMAVVLALVPMFLAAPSLADAQGIGVGVKGGFLHTQFKVDDATESGEGWMAGLFFGGNRPGTIGFMGEANILAKRSGDGNNASTIYYFQVPALLRVNIGSSSTSLDSAIVYAIGGPAIDLKIGEDLAGVSDSDEIESVDVSMVFGVGFEISRFIVEGRGTWGFRNIAKQSDQVDVKTRTFAILAGLRFN